MMDKFAKLAQESKDREESSMKVREDRMASSLRSRAFSAVLPQSNKSSESGTWDMNQENVEVASVLSPIAEDPVIHAALTVELTEALRLPQVTKRAVACR
ncbi:hypothetical protein Ddc_17498 [Ditylenchus destructor]|nr:hypothetical protein Ddc_17498 [Ditylenchus destructor]